MHSKDPMMEEPAFTDNLISTGKRLLVMMTVVIVSGATMLGLIGIFHPVEPLHLDIGWIIGLQFGLLFVLDVRVAEQKIGRLLLASVLIAISTPSFFFAFDMLLKGV